MAPFDTRDFVLIRLNATTLVRRMDEQRAFARRVIGAVILGLLIGLCGGMQVLG